MKYLLLLLLVTSNVFAASKEFTWNWPTLYCDGTNINPNTWISAELVYNTEPMPMPSDTDGPCGTIVDPAGPAGSISVDIATPVTSLVIDLTPNITYYARIRVCYDTVDNCSSWSGESVFTMGNTPNPPILMEF